MSTEEVLNIKKLSEEDIKLVKKFLYIFFEENQEDLEEKKEV
jgi:hypothetical protein